MSKLLEKILDKENIDLAIRQVKANKGSPGIDGMKVDEVEDYLREHGEELYGRIRKRKYKPLPVRRVEIPKPDGSKRPLGIPAVKDRVLQQAIVQVIAPMCEEVFSDSSYGFRENRSCEKAVLKALEYFGDSYDWLVDLDLSKFFDKVDQNILMILVHNIIKDGDTESIIRKFLQSGVNIGGTIYETESGTPQGGNLSPLLANIYLDPFDKELEKRGLRFTRYADDVLICVRSEAAANRVMTSVTRWLKEKLRVEVNATKTKVARPQDIKYLGFGFYFKEGQYRPKPHIKSIERFKKNLHDETRRNASTSILYKISRLNPIIRGWINYFRICDMNRWMEKLDAYLRVRIRMIIWKQWKKPKNRIRQLRKCGFPEWMANAYGNCRKGIMRCASSFMSRAITKETFDKAGLVSLLDYYTLKHTALQ
ncbi:MAG: group II intron reverse transcriptase/maturase [Clostridiales bacterium]|nr:group II intron reverse transcriptase/maturase [Clostridiales bacterium]